MDGCFTGLGGDFGLVLDICRRFAVGPKLARHLDLHRFDPDTPFGRFAVDVVAVAGRQGQKEQFAPVDTGAKAARFGRNNQALGFVIGAQADLMLTLTVLDV